MQKKEILLAFLSILLVNNSAFSQEININPSQSVPGVVGNIRQGNKEEDMVSFSYGGGMVNVQVPSTLFGIYPGLQQQYQEQNYAAFNNNPNGKKENNDFIQQPKQENFSLPREMRNPNISPKESNPSLNPFPLTFSQKNNNSSDSSKKTSPVKMNELIWAEHKKYGDKNISKNLKNSYLGNYYH